MTDEKKIALIADVMEVDATELTPQTVLSDLDAWDSIAVLSFIAMMDDEFHKIVKGAVVKSQNTVGDLMKLMEE